MACRYFGKGQWRGELVDVAGSNRCALITEAHSPCIMETPDQKACPRCVKIPNLPKLWQAALIVFLCAAGGASWGQMVHLMPVRLWLTISGLMWFVMLGWGVDQIILMRKMDKVSKGLRRDMDQLRNRITKAPYQ